MAMIEKIPLEPDDPSGASFYEIHDDGRQIWRNDRGQIVKSILPSELASELGKLPRGDVAEKERMIDAILKSHNADPENPEQRLLAQMISDGRYYSLGALSLLRKLCGQDDEKNRTPATKVEWFGPDVVCLNTNRLFRKMTVKEVEIFRDRLTEKIREKNEREARNRPKSSRPNNGNHEQSSWDGTDEQGDLGQSDSPSEE